MPELKPCPFCGGEARLKQHFAFAGCPSCLTEGPYDEVQEENPDDAITAWNTRPTEDALIAALEGMLGRYVPLVDSGDCGSWNPEEEAEVIAARALIAAHKGTG